MTHNNENKNTPFYISENPFIYSLFHTAGFVSHSVKYISHTVVFCISQCETENLS